MGSYANPSLLSRFGTILAGQTQDRVSDRSPTVAPNRPKNVQIHMTNQELEIVAAAYQDGFTLTELASAFGPDRLEKSGVVLRPPPDWPHDAE
jgi:hypothetical protein